MSEYKYLHLNTNCRDLESQWISIKQNIGREIILVNCYRPPQGDIEVCLRLLEERLVEFDLSKVDVFILGDLNINIFDKKDKKNQNFNSSLKQIGLLQQINDPTRITSKTATCIDLCYTNSNIVAKARVCNVSLSDHEMILVTRKKGPNIKVRGAFMGRSYRNFDKDLFRARLNDHNWEHLHDIVSPERKWAYFHQIVENILNQMCPIKEFRINKLKEPWITPQLLELIKDKDFKLKKAKKKEKKR